MVQIAANSQCIPEVIDQRNTEFINISRTQHRVAYQITIFGSLNPVRVESRINTAVYNATKNVISSLSQDRVITSRDGELSDMVMEAIGDNMEQYGIELIKFETKQLDLPDDNKAAVYERMISERDNIAATYKAEGDSEAKVIQNKTDKEVTIQISDAKKQAEILKAEGEQEYMKILSQAYGEDERSEFYSFVRSLEALKASMQGENKTVILSSDSPIAQIFEGK